MDDAAIATLEVMLEDINVGCSVTPAEEFVTTLTSVLDPPAIGSPLRIEGVSLEEVPVEVKPTAAEMSAATTGVTQGVLAIASYGTIGIESTADGDELMSLFPPRQVAVVPASCIHESMSAAFEWLSDAFAAGQDSIVFVTGNSATADMGATVEGVHGPAEVHAVVVEDR